MTGLRCLFAIVCTLSLTACSGESEGGWTMYHCADGYSFEVKLKGDGIAKLRTEGAKYSLDAAGSETRYEGEGFTLQIAGEETVLTTPRQTEHSRCKPAEA